MSRKYKFRNPDGIYFISFATINWMDVFVRHEYFNALVDSLDYCRKNKGMEVFAWCILPSHVHLIFRDKNANPSKLIKELKTYSSKKIQQLIIDHPQESRRAWLLWMMKRAGLKNSNVKNRQFWQQNNHPIELFNSEIFDQKVHYIHMNPVVSGFVIEPHHWRHSSAINFSGGKGVLEIDQV